jgi:uncharacterized protein RhaS with RHS repeats
VSGTLTTSFEYDGTGNRVSQTVGGVETQYALDVAAGLPEVILATRGGESTQYVQILGQILAQEEGSTWTYAAPDALGSVRQLADAAGQVSLAQGWDPFGVPLERSTAIGRLTATYPCGAQAGEWVEYRCDTIESRDQM